MSEQRARPSKQERALREHLRSLVATVEAVIGALDAEMKRPSDENRGKRIAHMTNVLEMEKDRARFFALNIDPHTGKQRSRAATKRHKAASRAPQEGTKDV